MDAIPIASRAPTANGQDPTIIFHRADIDVVAARFHTSSNLHQQVMQMNRDFRESVQSPKVPECLSPLVTAAGAGCQFLTSNRRTADQGPEPPPLFARTRHHIVS